MTRWFSLGFLVAIILCASSPRVMAGDISAVGLSASDSYDIYYYAGDAVAIIRDVEVVGIQQINNIDFLVVRAGEFKLKNLPGFIRFDSVQSILPSRAYRVEGNVIFQQ